MFDLRLLVGTVSPIKMTHLDDDDNDNDDFEY